MSGGDIKDRIRSYLADSFLSQERAASLRDDEDLLALLDSLQILRTVIHLESLFGIKVDDADLTPENLGSVEKLAALVARKRA
jgi:acyl carrier protein